MSFTDPLPGVMAAAMNRIIALQPEAQNKVADENGYEIRVYGRSFDLIAAFEELEHPLELLECCKDISGDQCPDQGLHHRLGIPIGRPRERGERGV